MKIEYYGPTQFKEMKIYHVPKRVYMTIINEQKNGTRTDR